MCCLADMSVHQRVAVTGASGLVGRDTVASLRQNGFDVLRLVRRAARESDEVRWDPAAAAVDRDRLEGVKAVVHLAGENIAEGRWTPEKKERIRQSRVRGTEVLAETLSGLSEKPEALISASAIGYYGNRGDEPLDEGAAAGDGFLASVCKEWEHATTPAEEAGIRVIHGRIGIVLSAEGGALAKMKLPFQLGLGGRIGDGRQYMSWIAIDDLVRALVFLLEKTKVFGAVNLVAPSPVTNAEFTEALGRALRRPTILPVPKFALRAVAGSELADEMLLGGARVIPKVLEDHGFHWTYPTLDQALATSLE